jgi:hypothetical protein
MPASTQTVSFDQAKDWSRRLHKAVPALRKLSAAQAAVASMLGHADWHALTRFYQVPTYAPDPALDPIEQELAEVRARYPGLKAQQVEVLAIELDEIEGRPEEIIEHARQLEYDQGMFASDALEQALEQAACTVYPPPGYRFVRVIDDQDRRVMTLLPFAPSPRPARPVPPPVAKPALAQFGHHPDPAIDFTVEVESLQSIMTDRALGLRPEWTEIRLRERVGRALQFRVGGDEAAVQAKAQLRAAWDGHHQVTGPVARSRKP